MTAPQPRETIANVHRTALVAGGSTKQHEPHLPIGANAMFGYQTTEPAQMPGGPRWQQRGQALWRRVDQGQLQAAGAWHVADTAAGRRLLAALAPA
jgi:hypothetical protein